MKSKICSACKQVKDVSKFNKKQSSSTGLSSMCKACNKEYLKNYSRSIRGLIVKSYNHQKENSIARKMKAPNYTSFQLQCWATSQPVFYRLLTLWEASGYLTGLKPSFDRLDDYKPYTLDNLQVITWGQNRAKYQRDRKNGWNNKQNKAVKQLRRDGSYIRTFISIAAAAGFLSHSPGHICSCCRGQRKTAAGFRWEYEK